MHCTHPVFNDSNYFFDYFSEKTSGYNLEAIDFSQGVTLAEFKDNKYLMNCRPGDYIESFLCINGCWEPHIITLISQFLDRSSGAMLDVGANIGANTIPLSVNHKDTKFYCYEPHPDVFAILESNIKMNKLDNVIPENIAVSNIEGTSLKFYAQKGSSNMGLSGLKLNTDVDEFEEIQVAANSLDDIFPNGSEKISLIKIDTQGTEPDVLASARNLIARDRPVIFFEFEDEYYSDGERIEAKHFISDLFASLDYSLLNITDGFDYFPAVDITRPYHGDLLAIPR
jgi:FkbM family methyltransferase